MQAVKRIEIVIDQQLLKRVTEILDNAGAEGYTVVNEVAGKGERGMRRGDALADVFTNCYILVACTPDMANAIVEALRPLLKQAGGMCLVSDAQWVKH